MNTEQHREKTMDQVNENKGSKLLGELKKKDRFRTVFFLSHPKDWHVISPQVSMSSPKAYGILLARSQLALRHVVLCSVKDGTLAERSALVRLQASLQTYFA